MVTLGPAHGKAPAFLRDDKSLLWTMRDSKLVPAVPHPGQLRVTGLHQCRKTETSYSMKNFTYPRRRGQGGCRVKLGKCTALGLAASEQGGSWLAWVARSSAVVGGDPWGLRLRAVTSRSGGLGGWDHPLLLLLLPNVGPVHIGLDCQGILRIYDLL